MPVTAKLNYLRIAPRKVRLVADLIRGKKVSEAQSLLEFTVKGSAKPIKKLLLNAIANAENNFGMEANNLFVSEIFVDEGPTLKRTRARAFGRFFPIHKRTSHITLVLDEIEKGKGLRRKPSFPEPTEGKEKKKRELKKPQRRPEVRKGLRPAFREKIQRTFRRKAF